MHTCLSTPVLHQRRARGDLLGGPAGGWSSTGGRTARDGAYSGHSREGDTVGSVAAADLLLVAIDDAILEPDRRAGVFADARRCASTYADGGCPPDAGGWSHGDDIHSYDARGAGDG